MTDDLAARLLRHVRDRQLFEVSGTALLAVSGGPDSVALVGLMSGLSGELGLELAVAHVDHGILEESSKVARQVEKLAARYSLECHVATLSLGGDATETRARAARYEALRAIQKRLGTTYLITAHHADDQVETVLYRFMRGSGTGGLAGIPDIGPNGLRRPLLPFHKAELAFWLENHAPDCGFFEDPSNLDARHDRSWLRAEVLPLLSERFGPELENRLLRVATHAAAERTAWSQILRVLPELGFRGSQDQVEVDRAPFHRYDKALSDGILRALAREVGCVIGAKSAARLREFARTSSSGHRLELGSGWEAAIAFSRLRISRVPSGDAGQPEPVLWGGADSGEAACLGWEFTWVREPAEESKRDSYRIWVTSGSGEIRVSHPGDRIFPLGGVGRRKVRKVLMEARVPWRDRASYPIVVRCGEVLWIPGVCRSDVDVPDVGEESIRLEASAAGAS
ncbi:MAG: tRNA lysidine(34) synthetase TilS [Gemmatimonadales bacterium]